MDIFRRLRFPTLAGFLFFGASYTLPLVAEPAGKNLAFDGRVVDAAGVRELIEQQNILVIDVRTAREFTNGHIAGALNIDIFAENFELKIDQLDRSELYLLHCKSGSRSSRALEIMQQLGFVKVLHFGGGFDAWKNAGLPVKLQ